MRPRYLIVAVCFMTALSACTGDSESSPVDTRSSVEAEVSETTNRARKESLRRGLRVVSQRIGLIRDELRALPQPPNSAESSEKQEALREQLKVLLHRRKDLVDAVQRL